jgi:hypothetical protein
MDAVSKYIQTADVTIATASHDDLRMRWTMQQPQIIDIATTSAQTTPRIRMSASDQKINYRSGRMPGSRSRKGGEVGAGRRNFNIGCELSLQTTGSEKGMISNL